MKTLVKNKQSYKKRIGSRDDEDIVMGDGEGDNEEGLDGDEEERERDGNDQRDGKEDGNDEGVGFNEGKGNGDEEFNGSGDEQGNITVRPKGWEKFTEKGVIQKKQQITL